MEKISEEYLEHISALCSKTTSGPWISYIEGRDHESGSSFIMTSDQGIELTGATIADQDFMAHAKQAVPLLINEIFRLRQLLESDQQNKNKL